jgi:hypothetical protein
MGAFSASFMVPASPASVRGRRSSNNIFHRPETVSNAGRHCRRHALRFIKVVPAVDSLSAGF